MLTLQDISYTHPGGDLLFDNLNFQVNNHDKTALTGNNGVGKSTLLKLIAGELHASKGHYSVGAEPYSIPQHFGQYDDLTIAQALKIEGKLYALNEILKGKVTEENYALLNDDWTIEERCNEALQHWQLDDLDLSKKMELLSGGQKTRVFLAGISIHQPQLVLLDEPSNHLDGAGRQLLYDFIETTKSTLIVVSHDRKLLNLMNRICELSKQGIRVYGGNYAFYLEQKRTEQNALKQDIQNREKAFRKAREKERETAERQQKLDGRGKKKQEKAGVAKIMMNTLRNTAENSTSRLKSVHAEKIGALSLELQELRSTLPDIDQIKFKLDNSGLHKGKLLFSATGMNFNYETALLWKEPLSFQITSRERIAIKGINGSGKTTLLKLITGVLEPQNGRVYRAGIKSIYIDQDYSLIDNALSIYEQALLFNSSSLQEHEIKIRLSRFLFGKDDWNKPCSVLSGGERMRLMLCCLTISDQAPDMIILDEPTNNLDLQNVAFLTEAINAYNGTLVAISHDETFLEQINIERLILL